MMRRFRRVWVAMVLAFCLAFALVANALAYNTYWIGSASGCTAGHYCTVYFDLKCGSDAYDCWRVQLNWQNPYDWSTGYKFTTGCTQFRLKQVTFYLNSSPVQNGTTFEVDTYDGVYTAWAEQTAIGKAPTDYSALLKPSDMLRQTYRE